MTNLLLFNLATDASDPLLGFTTTWINRLAACYDHIDVITMRAGQIAVAPNVRVYSVGKERGYGEARRAAEFYRLLSHLRRERPYAACFAHMMPLFAAMGAPLLLGVPITLWYTHRQAHRVLQLATAVSYRVVTGAPDSFPLPTAKLRVIGHGIDTEFFSPPHPLPLSHASEEKGADSESPSPLVGEEARTSSRGVRGNSIVHVARLMPIKHQATLIRALTDLPGARAVFVGDVPPDTDTAYRHDLEALARDLAVTDRVTFAGNQPPAAVRDEYRRAAAAVNLSPAGLFDKAALESMAVGVPTLVGSPAFDPMIDGYPLRLTDLDDSAALAAHLRDLLALPEDQRRAMGAALRERVVAAHSLDGLIQRLVSVLNTGEPA